jgi:hypothetical protein
MPRPIVFEGSQLGIQSAINDDAAADIKLLAPGFSRIEADSDGGYQHTNTGSRIATVTLPPGYFEGKVSYKGPQDWRCMLYVFCSYFGIPTPTDDGANGWIWDFFLGLNSGNPRTYYTYENGAATRAEKAINLYANTLTLNQAKLTQDYSGDMICGKKERGQTLTASPSEVAPLVIPSQLFNLYYGSTKAALDTAVSTDDRMLDPFVLSTVLTFPEVADRLPRMNSDEQSYAAVNEKQLAPTFAIKVTDEAAYDELEDLLDTGTPGFFALQALSDLAIASGASFYEARYDFCGTLLKPSTPEEEKSAVANMLTFNNQYDSIWGKAHNLRLVTDLDSIEP